VWDSMSLRYHCEVYHLLECGVMWPGEMYRRFERVWCLRFQGIKVKKLLNGSEHISPNFGKFLPDFTLSQPNKMVLFKKHCCKIVP
jgi:hypothetical protein